MMNETVRGGEKIIIIEGVGKICRYHIGSKIEKVVGSLVIRWHFSIDL